MAWGMDDCIVGGQIRIGTGLCPPIKEGDTRINGSMLCEGPGVFGGPTEFPGNSATIMIGRTRNSDPDCTPADHSLHVKGDIKTEGDGTNPAHVLINGTANADALGTLRILEAIRVLKLQKKTKFYQASTSEIFGNTEIPQSEKTPFRPRSPYAIAKLYAYWTTVNYREAYKIFAVNGILFNHEGPRRGETFVSRKVTRAVAEIYHKKRKFFTLGNLNAKRDWGSAKDYVKSMWLMLKAKKPSDYVIATGKSYTVKKFVEEAFKYIGVKISWRGKGINEVGIDKKTGQIYVKVDPKYFRPTEVFELRGDSSKAKRELKWKPSTNFKELVAEMMEHDLNEIK